MSQLHRIWTEDDGVLSFEWVVLGTIVVIGIVSGVAALRDAFIDEAADAAEAIARFDQSFTMEGALGFPSSSFTDTRSQAADPVVVTRP